MVIQNENGWLDGEAHDSVQPLQFLKENLLLVTILFETIFN